jgi:hypothetical protein
MSFKIFSRIFVGFLLVVTLNGCAAMKPQDFADQTPRFTFEEYFSGPTRGHGIFFDRFGKVQLRFVVDLNGTWNGDTLTLDEELRADNGEITRRTFTITKVDPHRYEVRTEDIVGVGTIEAYGNAVRWVYDLKQKIGDDVWVLSFDDWMYLQEDGVVLNRAYAKKFGITIGEVFMSVRKIQRLE